MSINLPNVPGLSALTTPGTWPNKGLNFVQSLGVDEYARLEAVKNNTEEKSSGTLGKIFQLVAPQYYSTFKLSDGKISQLFLALVLGQQRYEGMKMARGTDPSLLKTLAGLAFPNMASTVITTKLGVERLMERPLDALA